MPGVEFEILVNSCYVAQLYIGNLANTLKIITLKIHKLLAKG